VVCKKFYFSACGVTDSDSAATLFRTNTLATTLMDQYMRMTSTTFVHTAVQSTVNKIMESRQSCEVTVNYYDRWFLLQSHYLRWFTIGLFLLFADCNISSFLMMWLYNRFHGYFNFLRYTDDGLSVTGPMPWNSLHDPIHTIYLFLDDYLRLFSFQSTNVCSALEAFGVDALYKFSFYLLIYLLINMFLC